MRCSGSPDGADRSVSSRQYRGTNFRTLKLFPGPQISQKTSTSQNIDQKPEKLKSWTKSDRYLFVLLNFLGLFGLQGRDYELKLGSFILTWRDGSIRAIRTPRTPHIWKLQSLVFSDLGPGVLNILGLGVLNRTWGPRHFRTWGPQQDSGSSTFLGHGVLNRTWGPRHF